MSLSRECQELKKTGVWDSVESQIMSILNKYLLLVQLFKPPHIPSMTDFVNHIHSIIQSPKLVKAELIDLGMGEHKNQYSVQVLL